jgi:hypothetical protein
MTGLGSQDREWASFERRRDRVPTPPRRGLERRDSQVRCVSRVFWGNVGEVSREVGALRMESSSGGSMP